MSIPEAPLPPPPPPEKSNWQNWVGGTLIAAVVVGSVLYFSQEDTPVCDTVVDADCDGTRNSLDPDSYDIYVPPLNPGNGYTPPVPGRTTTIPPLIPRVPNNPVPTPPIYVPCNQRGGKDSNGNGSPDSCDIFPGGGDRDKDGLLDAYDSAPDNPDRDGDGLLDGQDREPDVNKNTKERKEQEERDKKERERKKRESEQHKTPSYMYGQIVQKQVIYVHKDPETQQLVIPRF